MTPLSEFSKRELLDELERRALHPVRPRPVALPAYGLLIEICESYLDDLEDEHAETDEDADHWIFEKLMEIIYGKMIWDYINSIS